MVAGVFMSGVGGEETADSLGRPEFSLGTALIEIMEVVVLKWRR